MDNNDLLLVIAVAETGKMSAAAEKLFVSQPYLSKKIARIEAECGIPLFERHAHGVALTPAGEKVYRHAREIETEFSLLEADLVREREKAGSLVICYTTNGVVPYVASIVKKLEQVVVPVPKSFLSITIETGIKMRPFSVLERSLCDLFLTSLPTCTEEVAKWADCTVLEKGGLCAFVSKDHPLAGRKTAKLEEVLQNTVVVPPKEVDGLAESICTALGFPERTVFSKDTTDFTIHIISHGCVGVMPYSSRTIESEYVHCLQIEEVSEGFDLVAAWRRNDKNPMLHKALNILLK